MFWVEKLKKILEQKYSTSNPIPKNDLFFNPDVSFEYVKWENNLGRPLQRCFSPENEDSMKELLVGEW